MLFLLYQHKSGDAIQEQHTNISVGTNHLMNFEGVGVAVTTQDMSELVMRLSNTLVYQVLVLTGITRGIDNTGVANHNENQRVSKYEFNGVSLRRINKTHNMNEVTSNPYEKTSTRSKSIWHERNQ